MDSDGVERDSAMRLLGRLADGEATLSADRDSEDPVAIRRVTDALWDKAEVLMELRRFDEAVATWDELLGRDLPDAHRLTALANKAVALVDLHRDADAVGVIEQLVEIFDRCGCPSSQAPVVARALLRQANTLGRLGRVDDQSAVERQLLDRFGSDPGASTAVAASLRNRALRLLRQPERMDELVAVSEMLRERFEGESEQNLAQVAEVLALHLHDLLSTIPYTPLVAVAARAGVSVANMSAGLIHAAHASLHDIDPRLGAVLWPADRAARELMELAPLARYRRRQLQALAVSRTLIDRLSGTEDPALRKMSATAQMSAAAALIGLGQVREGRRLFDRLFNGEERGAAMAFEEVSKRYPMDGRFAPAIRIVLLSARADALAQGDPAIARLAFEESLAGLTSQIANRRFLRLALRLTQPKRDSAEDARSPPGGTAPSAPPTRI